MLALEQRSASRLTLTDLLTRLTLQVLRPPRLLHLCCSFGRSMAAETEKLEEEKKNKDLANLKKMSTDDKVRPGL